jgi:hypothetical protein
MTRRVGLNTLEQRKEGPATAIAISIARSRHLYQQRDFEGYREIVDSWSVVGGRWSVVGGRWSVVSALAANLRRSATSPRLLRLRAPIFLSICFNRHRLVISYLLVAKAHPVPPRKIRVATGALSLSQTVPSPPGVYRVETHLRIVESRQRGLAQRDFHGFRSFHSFHSVHMPSRLSDIMVESEDGQSLPTTEDRPSAEDRMDVDDDAVQNLTEGEWEGMHNVLSAIYNYRTDDDEDPSKIFQRMVNRRTVPDYYDIIKEPMALSSIKTKLNKREYTRFEDFVRDFALIPYNAQVYNRPNSQAFQDALVIREVLKKELESLVASGAVAREKISLPDLGPIPEADEMDVDDAEEEEEEEDDDDESHVEDDDDSDDEGKRRRKRGRPLGSTKRDKDKDKEKDDDPDMRKKRGRPPRVDTPLEARIKAILKGLRKARNDDGELLVVNFERLPDKAAVPDYFEQISSPIALDGIKKKLKRKKYKSVDLFMKDVELMFENAKQYNEDDSDIYGDAVLLQQEARSLAEA